MVLCRCIILCLLCALFASCAQRLYSYDVAYNALEAYEGIIYHNNPDDPGGPTKFGWTLKTYQGLVDNSATVQTIKTLTQEDAKDLYKRFWWEQYGAEKVKDQKLAVTLFLAQINMGPYRPNRVLQTMTNDLCDTQLKPDGVLGKNSITEINACKRLWPGYPYYLHLAYKNDPAVGRVWAWAKNGLRNRVFHNVRH